MCVYNQNYALVIVTQPKEEELPIRLDKQSKCLFLIQIYKTNFVLLWSFPYEPWAKHIPVQIHGNHKIKVWTHPNLHVYRLYIQPEHVFYYVIPSIWLLKIWGILALFGDIWDAIFLFKCHNLKNIREIDKKQSWFYHFIHVGTIWAMKNWVICIYLDIFIPLW